MSTQRAHSTVSVPQYFELHIPRVHPKIAGQPCVIGGRLQDVVLYVVFYSVFANFRRFQLALTYYVSKYAANEQSVSSQAGHFLERKLYIMYRAFKTSITYPPRLVLPAPLTPSLCGLSSSIGCWCSCELHRRAWLLRTRVTVPMKHSEKHDACLCRQTRSSSSPLTPSIPCGEVSIDKTSAGTLVLCIAIGFWCSCRAR